MEELKKELKQKFNWIVWDLNSIIQKYGALGAVKFLIDLLWEWYYSKKPPIPKQEIIMWIGELEYLLSKYSKKSREEV